VVLAKATAGIPKASVVNVTQIATVDKAVLLEEIGQLDDDLLDTIAVGLRRSLEL
jgi:mRNA-degrading endonuclease toxin of MazEF toxin-antitoxin module